MTFDDEMMLFNLGFTPVFSPDASRIVGWFNRDCTKLHYCTSDGEFETKIENRKVA